MKDLKPKYKISILLFGAAILIAWFFVNQGDHKKQESDLEITKVDSTDAPQSESDMTDESTTSPQDPTLAGQNSPSAPSDSKNEILDTTVASDDPAQSEDQKGQGQKQASAEDSAPLKKMLSLS